MNIERFRKIIAYSAANREVTASMVKKFCAYANMDVESDVLNILQIVRGVFQKRGYLVLEMPLADDEIGALCYKGDGLGYVVINTSLPKSNNNFALTHEIYHVLFQKNEFVSKVEFADDHYYENEEEYAANLFAGTLLMPENSFIRMHTNFKAESEGREFDTIMRLMSYYQVPYMAVLIRCFELGLINENADIKKLMETSKDAIKDTMNELWLDSSGLEPTKRDDYPHMEQVVLRFGRECIDENYINERTLEKVIQNMRSLRKNLRGDL